MSTYSAIKEDLACTLCQMVTEDPRTFPCGCLFCSEHLTDQFVKKGNINCPKCDRKFEIANERFPPSNIILNILKLESYLDENEKKSKIEINKILENFYEKNEKILVDLQKVEAESIERFSKLINDVDLHREKLKERIDDTYMPMINELKEHEKVFYQKIANLNQTNERINIEMERKKINKEFRKLNLNQDHIKSIISQNQAKLNDIEVSIKHVKQLNDHLNSFLFKPSLFPHHLIETQGLIIQNLEKYLVSCSWDKTIKKWSLDDYSCIQTFHGHTNYVTCLENMSKDVFLSGSYD